MILFNDTFYITPHAQERPRVRVIAKKGCKPFATVYDPTKSKDFKKALGELVKLSVGKASGYPLAEPLVLTCTVFIQRPKSVTRKFPEVKPDLSNYIKGIEDAMNGIVYTDDSKIVDYGSCRKRYTDSQPRIEVTLYSVE
jgi:Holliday junction resolvase RusA-like endonuclease